MKKLNITNHQGSGKCKWRSQSDYWDNVDETGGYYPEWNKPGTESYVLHDLTYVGVLKSWT